MRRLSPCELPLTDWQREERYLYSGKELERGKGLMLYDFHARQYDPQLGRFTSPDPLRDDYPGLDPYLYCAANPISFIDPTGMYMRGSNKDFAQNYLDYLGCLKINLMIQDYFLCDDLGRYDNVMKERINIIDSNINDVNSVLSVDNIEFKVTKLSAADNKNATTPIGTNEMGDMLVDIRFENNNGKTSHEFKHAHQIVTGVLVFDENNNPKNYGIRHEVEAYTAEFGTNGYIYYIPPMTINPNDEKDRNNYIQFRLGCDSFVRLKSCITSPSEITPEIIRQFSEPDLKRDESGMTTYPIYENLP